MSRRFLLDAGPAQDFVLLRDPVFSRARREQLNGAKIGVCYPTLGEVRGGIEYSQTRDVNLKRLARAIGKLVLWPFDEKAAEEYGRVFATLRRIGRMMQQIDIQVAAVAFALGDCTVVTVDSDLSAVPGLSVADWSKEV
jgi:tRNA(fMet)-specific endonuclease VapC